MILSIIGCAVICVAVVLIFAMWLSPALVSQKEGGDNLERYGEINSADVAGLCKMIEWFSDLGILVFDRNLKLLAAGERALVWAGENSEGQNLVDIVPAECCVRFLEEISSAQKGVMREWECLHGNCSVLVRLSMIGKNLFVVAVKESKRLNRAPRSQ